jgi:outer membrane protein assembly factor BamB
MQYFLLACCLFFTDHWPQFRGPNSDAHVSDSRSPLEWSDTENVRWKVPIAGLGWSSPVVVENRVYLTTAVPNDQGLSLRAMAIDAESGESLWDREVRNVAEVPAIHTKNSHASPTPIVQAGRVFVHFGALGTACLESSDGSLVWRNTELDYPHVHGSGGSPVLYDGKLVVVCDGSSQPFVAALDAQNGKVVWQTARSIQPRISHSFVTPTLAQVGDTTQLLAPGPDHMAAYDPASGEELWKIRAPGWSVVPQPAVGHGMVFYNHDYDHPELIGAKLDGSGDVTESHIVWRIKRGAPSTPSPLLIGDELYFVADNGIATCVDAKTGHVHWAERLGGNFSSSPVYANDHILFLSEAGTASWVQPGKEYKLVVENVLPGRTFATPAFAGDAMYLRTDEHLYKIAKEQP